MFIIFRVILLLLLVSFFYSIVLYLSYCLECFCCCCCCISHLSRWPLSFLRLFVVVVVLPFANSVCGGGAEGLGARGVILLLLYIQMCLCDDEK